MNNITRIIRERIIININMMKKKYTLYLCENLLLFYVANKKKK